MSSVLVLSHERLGRAMTGPSIRNWQLAAALSKHFRVTLAVPGQPQREHPGFQIRSSDDEALAGLVADHDVVLCSGFLLDLHPVLRQARHLAIDLYGPFTLESLHQHEDKPLQQRFRMANDQRAVVLRLLAAGDVFICASERQRDFWTGWLGAAGRLNPYVHSWDPSLRSLLREVPFGVEEEPPRPGPPRFRGVKPGIAADDFIVLWYSGIWNWFDPLTLIRAADRVRERLPKLRLVFATPVSPSEAVIQGGMVWRARRLAEDLGLLESVVFFGDTFIDYEERGSVLLEADLCANLYFDDVETRYSFRTRLLDLFWAGRPILTTRGDVLSDLVAAEGAGVAVRSEDLDGVAAALLELGGDPTRLRECGLRSAEIGKRFRWSLVTEPLIDYCRAPFTAPDRALMRKSQTSPAAWRLARRTVFLLREEGPAGVFRGALRRFRRRRRLR